MSNKKKDKEGFWKQLFRRYDVVITQRGGKDTERRVRASWFSLFLCILAAIFIGAIIATLLLFYSPLKSLTPGYITPEMRRQMIESVLRLDSMSEVMQRHQTYVMNIQDILRGEIKIDSTSTIDSLTILSSKDLMQPTEREKAFNRKYEENERYNLTTQGIRKRDMEGLHFYPPLRGALADSFNPTNHHMGIDIIPTNFHQNVCAVLDGTILMSDYTANNGYTVVLQHVGNIVTIYRHLSALFYSEGEKVKAGQSLGIVGVQGDKMQQPYLHFELWHKGTVLNPTQYITF